MLGKTESKLLVTALRADYSSHQFVVNCGYRSHTKSTKWGDRDSQAAIKLLDKGLVKHIETRNYTAQNYYAYGSDHWHEAVFQLTETGLALAKTLTDDR